MTAAPECPPEVYIPARARRAQATAQSRRRALPGSSTARLQALTREPSSIGQSAWPAPVDDGLTPATVEWGSISWHRASRGLQADDASAQSGPRLRSRTRVTLLTAQSSTRLTRRAAVAVFAAVLIAAVGVAGIAWASAPKAQSATPSGTTVAVKPGDTLWSIAVKAAPNRDPRAEVDELSRLNNLRDGQTLNPGQILRTR